MEDKSFEEIYKQIIDSLEKKLLIKAQSLTIEFCKYVQNSDLIDQIESCNISYRSMLQFMSKGVTDKDKYNYHNDFIRKTYEIVDSIMLEYKKIYSSDYIFSESRMIELTGKQTLKEYFEELLINGETLQEEKQKNNFYSASNAIKDLKAIRYKLLQELFMFVWTQSFWTKEDEKWALKLVESDKINVAVKAVFISAVTLAIMLCLDERKMNFLFSSICHKNIVVQTRSVMGLIFAQNQYANRFIYYPNILAQFKLMERDEKIESYFYKAQLQLLISLETQEIGRQITKDIVDKFFKNKKISNIDFSNLDKLMSVEDLNPKWDNKELKEIEDRIKQIQTWHEQGADLYMQSFSQLKNQFPFFNKPINWFMLFDHEHPELITNGYQNSDFMKMMMKTNNLCHSDRYSLAFLFSSSSNISGLLRDSMTDMAKSLSEKQKITPEFQEWDDAIRFYMQDLYRFFKLFKYRLEFVNPFKSDLLFVDKDIPDNWVIISNHLLNKLANFEFMHRKYENALRIYVALEKRGVDFSAENNQKIGYSLEKLNKVDEAIVYYEKAFTQDDTSSWVMRRLAYCYKKLGNYDSALHYLNRLIGKDKINSVKIDLQIGQCYLLKEEYQKALDYFLKVDYLDMESRQVKRAIAWCSLLTGKLEQSESYYSKLLNEKASSQDYFNAGHVAWASGQISLAASRYYKAIYLRDNVAVDEHLFDEDEYVLRKYNISYEDQCMMIDYLNLEN